MEAREQSFVAALGPSEMVAGGGLNMGIGGGGGVGLGATGGEAEVDIEESPSSSPSLSPTPSPPPLVPPSVPVAGGMEGIVQQLPPPPGAGMMGPAMAMGIGMAAMGSGGAGSEDLMLLGKKKRGRPRKYGPDGMALALSPNSASPYASSDPSGKRGRGRPAGSGKRQLLAALGEWFTYSAGGNFTPHVVTVATGEDVAAKILSFSQKGPRAICILSANGAISNVTLRQPGSCGGTLTYEGRFEILSLSGSFTVTEDGGIRSRTGGISVSLAGPDGRVVGGGVAGMLLAASPIQVVVGSFMPNTFKEHKKKATADGVASATHPATGVLTAAKPISQANPDGDCETPTSTLPGQVHGDVDSSIGNLNRNTPYGNQAAAGWHGLHSSEHRSSPDINICLHGE